MYFLGHFLSLLLFAGLRVFRTKNSSSKKQQQGSGEKKKSGNIQEAADGLDPSTSTNQNSRHAFKQD